MYYMMVFKLHYYYLPTQTDLNYTLRNDYSPIDPAHPQARVKLKKSVTNWKILYLFKIIRIYKY